MRKIPTLYIRDPATNLRHVKNEVHPDAQWVIDGEGVATRKYDGTCCLIRDGKLYKRHEVRPGKATPEGFEAADEVDPNTGKQPGWVPVGDGPEDRWHREAVADDRPLAPTDDGTYELVGPKVQGNPEGWSAHALIRHTAAERLADVPRDFEGLRDWLLAHEYEGIVWHHPDGRMAKLKRKDFPRAT